MRAGPGRRSPADSVKEATLLVGGAVVLNDYIDDNNPQPVWLDYQAFGTTREIQWAFFVPEQLRTFIDLANSGIKSRANGIVVMGAPITASEKAAVRARLGSLIVESWGNSESLGTITDLEDLELRPGSVERPFLTDELMVVGEDGAVVQPNVVGRVAGGEEAGFEKYSGRPEATECVKRNKLIISDDIGYMDEQGYLYLRGRQQDTFIIGGKNYFVSDIEEGLRSVAGVEAAAVVPLPSEVGDARLRALVVQEAGSNSTETELLRQLNSRLSGPVVLERVVIVDRIPKVPAGGKVDKSKCRALVMTPD